MAKKAGTSLGLVIFLIIGLLVATTAVSAVVATLMGRELGRKAIEDEIQRAHSAQSLLLLKQADHLELEARFQASQSEIREYLSRPLEDAEAEKDTLLRTQIEQFREEQDLDLVVLTDPEGRVIFRSGSAAEPALDEVFTIHTWLEEAEESTGDVLTLSATGLRRLDDIPVHMAVTKVVVDFNLVGHLALAAPITSMAAELGRVNGSEVLMYTESGTGPTVIASTANDARQQEVIGALRLQGAEALGRIKRGESVPSVELTLGGEPWLAFLTPLKDPAGEALGGTVAFVSVTGRLDIYRQTILLLAAVGGGALVLGFLLSLLLGRRILAPVNRLAALARELAHGNYEVDLPPAKGNFGPLVPPLQDLARRLRDRDTLGSFLGRALRELPEPGQSTAAAGGGQPAAGQPALLMVEMRRFANPKISYDPEENISRYARDLRRIANAVETRQGVLESVSGHRILIAFEGEGRSFRALGAATEILLILITRENAFDEPAAPVLAMSLGPVVTGQVRWGSRVEPAVAGLPVQQLESLMREATPGEIFFSKEVAQELVELCQRGNVQMQAQRGIMNPQPLYKLALEGAQQLTGAQAPAAGQGAAQVTSISDLVPGTVLGGRFEVLAELGRGPLGAVFKCQDSDRGDLVKLKALQGEYMSDPNWIEHLKQVLELARVVSHPNFYGVYDFGQLEGLAFITSPFVHGTNLRFLMQKGMVPLGAAFLIGRQIAEGLVAAHRQKLVHGLLKPENVLVEPSGNVQVMDFGLSPPLDPSAGDAPHAAAAYLAPERIGGYPAAPKADVYGWGLVVYEMVTGSLPAFGNTPNEVQQARHQKSPDPPSTACPDIPAGLEEILLRCLEVEPGQRFGSMLEVTRALDALRA